MDPTNYYEEYLNSGPEQLRKASAKKLPKKFKESCNLIGWEQDYTHFKPLHQFIAFMKVYPYAKNSIHTSTGYLR